VWRTPANALPFTLALAASALPLIDLARTRGWALAFSLALTLTAAAVGLLALLQNLTHAQGIYWRDDGRMPGNFCGTFFHHTAAGAYFNTAWPLAVALTWLASAGPVLAAAGWLMTIVLLAAQGSHVSRFPQVAALIVAPFLLRGLGIRFPRRWFLAAGAAAAVGLLVALAGRPGDIGTRWRLMFVAAPAGPGPAPPPESAWPALIRDDLFIPYTSREGWFGDRGESWRTALRSIAERPLTGHGPGNWMGAASRNTGDPFVRTFYQFLQFTHQDLLQFAVEWGVPATLGWWGLLAGGIVAVLRARRRAGPPHRPLALGAACALAAVLLQAQLDFPLQIPAVALNVIVLAALCWAGGESVEPELTATLAAP
jgi:O-antigen ligase